MKETLKFTESKDKLKIEIYPSVSPIIKFGLIFQGVLLIATALFLTSVTIRLIADIPIAAIIIIALCVVYVLAGREYLKKVLNRESLEISKDQITIINKQFGSIKTKSFSISEVSSLEIASQNNYTKHPLDNGTVDITGLGVTEQQLQYVTEGGTIDMRCNGMVVRFASNIASWDSEEVINRIKQFTGNNFKNNDQMKVLLNELYQTDENENLKMYL